MAIEWKSNSTWQPVRNRQTDTWVDAAGAEWDIDYITRFERLGASIRGTVVCAWHPDYEDTRRNWLGSVEKWPAAMVLCLEDSDIETCCAFAKKFDHPISLRSAEHALTDRAVSDGAIVLDMSLMHQNLLRD